MATAKRKSGKREFVVRYTRTVEETVEADGIQAALEASEFDRDDCSDLTVEDEANRKTYTWNIDKVKWELER